MELNVQFMFETLKNSLSAVPVTLKLTLIPLLLAAPVSLLFAVAQIKKIRFLGRFAALYVSFVRGTPAVVLVLLLYNTLPGELAAFFKAIGSDFNVYKSIKPIMYAYLIFTLTAIAALTEICRAAIQAVDKGQLEGAYSVGLNTWQAYRRIILPQAFAMAMPNLCSLTVAMVKNTSLAFMMTVKDITQTARLGAALNYCYAEAYIVILIVYIVICLVMEQIFKVVERRLIRYRSSNAG